MSKRRGAQLENVAYKMQMAYRQQDDWGLLRQLQDFRLMNRGFRGRARHILRQQEGLMTSNLCVFDYRYLVWSGKSTRRVEQTVFFIESQQLSLPEFLMRPENFFHKIGELLGMDDIDFEQYPDFSSNYRLIGEDETYIRHRFTDQVLRLFSVERGWTMEGLGFYLLLYKKNKVLSPSRIQALHSKGMEVFEALVDEGKDFV